MGRTFAIGDIHGCFRTLFELLIRVIDLKKSDRLILLGDYIDRGDQIRDVIDFIIDLKEKGFDIVTLRGNHEQMLLDSVSDVEMFTLWMMNKGASTLESFGVSDASGLEGKYLEFFRSLANYTEIGNILFVHAGFNDFIDNPFSDTESMIWNSGLSYNNPLLKDRIIIHGHRPKQVAYVEALLRDKSRVIPIDTGCVYDKELGYGNLSALNIQEMKLISLPRQ